MSFLDFFRKTVRAKATDPFEAEFGPIARQCFPQGEENIAQGVREIAALLQGAAPVEVCRQIAVQTKVFYTLSRTPTRDKVILHVISNGSGHVSKAQAESVYAWLVGDEKKRFTGGNGLDVESAVVVNAPSSVVGIKAEYEYLEGRFGPRATWNIDKRIGGERDGRSFEVFYIKTDKPEVQFVVFDITSFHGKA